MLRKMTERSFDMEKYLDYLSGKDVDVDGIGFENGIVKGMISGAGGAEHFFKIGTISSKKMVLNLPTEDELKDVLMRQPTGKGANNYSTIFLGPSLELYDQDDKRFDYFFCYSGEKGIADHVWFLFSNKEVKYYNHTTKHVLIGDEYYTKIWDYQYRLNHGWNLVWEHSIFENNERDMRREYKTDLTNIPQNLKWQCINHVVNGRRR
jgi:hypothetical protein